VSRGIPRTKKVGSSIKYATLAVTKVALVKIVLKLKLFIHKVVKVNISYVEFKNDTSITKMISSFCNSLRVIWIPKHLLTNHEGPNKTWITKLA
jgi:hypothetical protein